MPLYPDYAPKKKKFRLFETEDVMPPTPAPQEDPVEVVPEKAAEEPRRCLRCTDTEMKFYRTVKLQTEGYYGPGGIQSLFRDDDDPDQAVLLPVEIWACPKCRRMEMVWGFATMPDGERLPEVVKYEQTFEYCTEQQLRQVLEGEKFNADMKQAARNLLRRNYDCWT